MATTILSLLQKDAPDQFSDGLLRTLQRKIAHWKALNGPEKSVIFPQIYHPGEQELSDFTQQFPLNILLRIHSQGIQGNHLSKETQVPTNRLNYCQTLRTMLWILLRKNL